MALPCAAREKVKLREWPTLVKRNGVQVGTLPLSFAGRTSMFSGLLEVTEPSVYELQVYAYDPETGNTGVDKTVFRVGEERHRVSCASHGGDKMKMAKLMVIITMLFMSMTMGMVPQMLYAGEPLNAKELVQRTCAGCHRLDGSPVSRFEKKAPDLIGIGSKFKHEWLVGWLEGKE